MSILRRGDVLTLLVVCIFATFALTCLLAMSSMPMESCSCNDEPLRTHLTEKSHLGRRRTNDGRHRLAVLVPFRDRFDELLTFAPHIDTFLARQNLDYGLFVVNQVDAHRFNRAALINVGFLYVRDEYDYIAMHDVDLLPLNPNLSYAYPKDGPFHVASPDFHPRYNYSTFVGGILLVNREHFETVDGMSNKYWGWGLEDDEFYVRLKEAKLNVTRPTGITTDRSNTIKHIHDRTHRKRDTVKCFNQYESTRRRDRKTGLHNVDFELQNVNKLTVDGVPVTVVNVKLNCDIDFTPWCDCQRSDPKKAKAKS